MTSGAAQHRSSTLGSIGHTPLVELRRVVPPGSARVVVKVEGHNPTGSMKDRAACAMIEAAMQDGRLAPGGTVVEYSGGSMGTALAFVCAALGFRIRLYTSDAFSQEKRDHMAAFGAEVVIVPSDEGRITAALIQEMISRARHAAQMPGVYWTDQLNNEAGARGYAMLAEELRAQCDGPIDAFVGAVGTGHSLHGVGAVLRAHMPGIRIVAVEPAESPVLSQGRSGAHRIEGIGIGFVPPLWKREHADEITCVSTDDAWAMARRLATHEGLMAGASSGANVVAALRLAERLGPGATVATMLCDAGAKYLSTPLFKSGS